MQPLRNIAGNAQTQKSFISWVTLQAFNAQSPINMPQKDLHITPKVSYFSFKYVIKYVIKTNINSGAKPWSDPLQSAGSRALFYPISIISQISNEDSGIFQLTENAKFNNYIAGYHLVSRRVMSAPSDGQRVYRCPKRTFILPPKISYFSFKYVIIVT